MTWAKFDDKFHAHPKALRAGLAGCGLFLRAVTYCCDHLTDGHIPEEWVATQLGPNDGGVPDRLVECGLWRETPAGFEILDFLDFNPSRESVLAKRAKRAAAGRAGAAKRWSSTHSAEPVANAIANAMPVAKATASHSHDHVHGPNRTGTGTGLNEEQQRLVERIGSVTAIFARFGFDVDEASILNALERGRGVDGLDHEDLARKCAEWCRTHDRPPAPTFHTFIDRELARLAETREREEHAPTHAGMNARETCKDCGVPIKTGKRCRECDRQLEERLAGGAAA